MPNQKAKITKTVVDRLTAPASGQVFIRDTELKGFGVRITANGVISFIVEKRVNGQVRRKTLGRYGEITVEQARKRAQQFLGQVAMGVDPIAEKRRARAEGVTLAQSYADFLKARSGLKAKTRYDYERLYTVAFGDWHSKRLTTLSRAMITQRHQQLGNDRGEAYANLAMRFLRALFNFAIPTYDDGNGQPILRDNPVAVLTHTRAWYRNERRQTVIKVHQLHAWFAAVSALRADSSPSARVVGDYLLLLLFTGLRRQEAATLRWDDIDLKDETLRIRDPKNREPFVLPLSSYVLTLLGERRAAAINDYVFPDRDGHKHLVEPKRQIQNVIERSDVPFTLHDLRRTFITIAEGLNVPPYTIKRLVNHKMRGDVTAGYVVSEADHLREQMQKITDFLILRTSPVDAQRNSKTAVPRLRQLSST